MMARHPHWWKVVADQVLKLQQKRCRRKDRLRPMLLLLLLVLLLLVLLLLVLRHLGQLFELPRARHWGPLLRFVPLAPIVSGLFQEPVCLHHTLQKVVVLHGRPRRWHYKDLKEAVAVAVAVAAADAAEHTKPQLLPQGLQLPPMACLAGRHQE